MRLWSSGCFKSRTRFMQVSVWPRSGGTHRRYLANEFADFQWRNQLVLHFRIEKNDRFNILGLYSPRESTASAIPRSIQRVKGENPAHKRLFSIFWMGFCDRFQACAGLGDNVRNARTSHKRVTNACKHALTAVHRSVYARKDVRAVIVKILLQSGEPKTRVIEISKLESDWTFDRQRIIRIK